MTKKNNKKQSNIAKVAVPGHRHFLFTADFVIPMLILVAGTILFRLSEFDLQIQRFFYDAQRGWWLGSHSVFQFIYHYGNVPALLLALGGIAGTALSYHKPKYVKWRKIGIFLVLSMVIGPGLIVNTILKDNWGRPRPRNVDEFGGKYRFEEILTMDRSSDGKSFPCGHATMGYYLFVPWFLLRKRRSAIAYLSLSTGIVYGLIIGFVRMAQGGHFASDVLWAGVIVYLVAYTLFRLLKLNNNLYYISHNDTTLSAKKSKYHFLLWLIGLVIVFAILLATPYERKQSMKIQMDQTEMLEFSLAHGDVTIQADSLDIVTMLSSGFAFPSSRIKLIKRTNERKTATMLFQDKKGIFTELIVHTDVTLDRAHPLNLAIDVQKGDLVADLSAFQEIKHVSLSLDSNTARLKLPQNFTQKLYIEDGARVLFVRTNLIFTDDPDKAAIIIFNSNADIRIE